MFRVGMKVVCVDINNPSNRVDMVIPSLNSIYTIRDLVDGWVGPALRLREIVNDDSLYLMPDGSLQRCEGAYNATRFRPVVERETDISIFTALLTPAGSRPVEVV